MDVRAQPRPVRSECVLRTLVVVVWVMLTCAISLGDRADILRIVSSYAHVPAGFCC